MGKQGLPEPAGEAQRLGSLAEAVAVGRIHHEKSRWRWNLIVPEVGHREANIVRDLRANGVAAGNLHGAGVAIRSENRCVCSRARGDGLAQALPRVRVMRGPAFKGEGAAGTWQDLARQGRRLDGDGAGAAHGIRKRQRRIVCAKCEHASGQGFAQGGAPSLQTPAAPVQKRARGIDAGREAVVLATQENARAVVLFLRLRPLLSLGQVAHAVRDG